MEWKQWTEVNDLNTARNSLTGAGTSTAAIAFGGATSPQQQNESWNGSSWTEVNDLNTGRALLGGAGTSTSGLAFGGQPNTANTETWNGTSWTEVNNLNTARHYIGGAGSDNTSSNKIRWIC